MKVHEVIAELERANPEAEVVFGAEGLGMNCTILDTYTEHEGIIQGKDGSVSRVSPKSLIFYVVVGEKELDH